jgi:hypothetical protein
VKRAKCSLRVVLAKITLIYRCICIAIHCAGVTTDQIAENSRCIQALAGVDLVRAPSHLPPHQMASYGGGVEGSPTPVVHPPRPPRYPDPQHGCLYRAYGPSFGDGAPPRPPTWVAGVAKFFGAISIRRYVEWRLMRS